MRYARSKEKRRGRQGGPLRKACLLSAESVLWICEAAFASTTSSMLAAAIAGLYAAKFIWGLPAGTADPPSGLMNRGLPS